MDTIREKINKAKEKSYRGQPVGVLMSLRIPPLLVEGVIAHMNANGLKSFSAAFVDLLQEGLIHSGTK